MAITFRRSATGQSDGFGTTIAATYSSTDFGDLAWLGIGWDDPAGTIDVTTVVDSAGNPWSATPAGKKRNVSQHYSARMYYVPTGIKASSGNLVTVTLSGTCLFKRLSLLEYRSSNGPWTFSPLDQSAGTTGNSSSPSSGNMTPVNSGELVAGWGGTTGAGDIGATSPYVARAFHSDKDTGAIERVLSGGAGIAVAATATSPATEDWVMLGATFTDVPGVDDAAVVVADAAVAIARGPFTSSNGRARALLVGGSL